MVKLNVAKKIFFLVAWMPSSPGWIAFSHLNECEKWLTKGVNNMLKETTQSKLITQQETRAHEEFIYNWSEWFFCSCVTAHAKIW